MLNGKENYWRGRLSTVDLRAKVACFILKSLIFEVVKSLTVIWPIFYNKTQ